MQRILIVDDEKDLATLLADELTEENYEVDTAGNGVEAVLRVFDFDWDVLLMDIRMPNLDGINALKIIRHIKPNLPVIMFTGQAARCEIAETTRLGAAACLMKPVQRDHLLQALRQVI